MFQLCSRQGHRRAQNLGTLLVIDRPVIHLGCLVLNLPEDQVRSPLHSLLENLADSPLYTLAPNPLHGLQESLADSPLYTLALNPLHSLQENLVDSPLYTPALNPLHNPLVSRHSLPPLNPPPGPEKIT